MSKKESVLIMIYPGLWLAKIGPTRKTFQKMWYPTAAIPPRSESILWEFKFLREFLFNLIFYKNRFQFNQFSFSFSTTGCWRRMSSGPSSIMDDRKWGHLGPKIIKVDGIFSPITDKCIAPQNAAVSRSKIMNCGFDTSINSTKSYCGSYEVLYTWLSCDVR